MNDATPVVVQGTSPVVVALITCGVCLAGTIALCGGFYWLGKRHQRQDTERQAMQGQMSAVLQHLAAGQTHSVTLSPSASTDGHQTIQFLVPQPIPPGDTPNGD